MEADQLDQPSQQEQQQEQLDNTSLNSNLINDTILDRPINPMKTKNDLNYDDLPIGKSNKPQDLTSGNIDDLPVGGSNKNQFFNEYPEGYDPNKAALDQKEEETGPLSVRVKSKVWKIRQVAFEELIKKFDEAVKGDVIFDEFAGDLSKFIADVNPGAQEKALLLMKGYLDKFKSLGPIDPKETTKTLIDKVIAPGKPNTKKIAYEIQFFVFEKGDKNQIFEALIDSINHKMQKTSVAGIQTLTELLKTYGPKKLDYLKPFLPHLEKHAGSTVASQRNEAMNFYKQAYLFLGEALKPFIAKLKKQQAEELDKYYEENAKDLPQPLKGGGDEVSGSNQGADKGGAVAQIDAYDISDPVEIFNKFNENWTEKVLAQAKWNDKKQMLDDLLNAASVPKLANTSHQHIHAMLKKLLNDSNVVVMTLAIKIYGVLAKGLRRHFSGTCKIIASYILAKFREKKTQVIEETSKTLENFLYCITPDDIIEDVKEALNDKTGSVKQNTLLWIEKYLEKMNKTPEKCVPLFKNLLPIMKKLLDDSLAEVRDSTMTTLAKFKVTLGDSSIGTSYDDIASAKLSKIMDIATKLGGKPNNVSQNPKSQQVIPQNELEEEKEDKSKLAVKKGLGSNIKSGKEEKNEVSQIQRPQTSSSKIPPGSSGAAKAKPGANTKTDKKLEDDLDGISTLSSEDAEAKLRELGLPEDVANGLSASEWQEKKRCLTEFSQWLDENTDNLKDCLEHILRFLKSKLKDWKESNMNTLKETLNIMINITKSNKLNLTKKSFNVVVQFIVNNIGDSKYNEMCCSLVINYIEVISPKFVINQIIGLVQNSKPSVKLIIETTNLLTKLLDLVTVKYFPLKDTIEYGKFVINNSNAQVRAAGNKLFTKLYEQVGQPINDFLTDINPQLLKTLQSEFERITPINSKDLDKLVKINVSKEGGNSQPETNPLDSLPRADISKEIEKWMKKLTDGDWKVRKEALEACENILANNHNRILANGLNDFVGLLKGRLQDPNKSLVKAVIVFTGKFIAALGKDSRQYAKILLGPLSANLTDKQAVIRADTVATLDKFAAEIGLEAIINSLLPNLSQENPEIRSEIMNWTLKNQEGLLKADIKGNVGPILATLQDKTKEIRNLGEQLLEKCIQIIGIGPFHSGIKDFKPAIQQAIKIILEKYNNAPANIESEDSSIASGDASMSNKSMKKSPSEAQSMLNKTPKIADKTPQQNRRFTASPNRATPTQSTGNTGSNSEYLAKSNIPSTSFSQAIASPANNVSQSIFFITGQKPQRFEEEAENPWPINELNDDLAEKLRDTLKRNVSTELYTKLFSFDARKNTEAINILKKAINTEIAGTIDNLDLIFKWVFLKLWDNSNFQIVNEIVDYILSLTFALEANKYKILDWEMFVLAPCLMGLFAKFTPEFRTNLHKIWHKLGSIYSSQKIVGIFSQNLENCDDKVQFELLETITELLQLYGKDSITPNDIKLCAGYLRSNDPDLQKSAQNLFIELGSMFGESILRMLDGIPSQYFQNLFQFGKKPGVTRVAANFIANKPTNVMQPQKTTPQVSSQYLNVPNAGSNQQANPTNFSNQVTSNYIPPEMNQYTLNVPQTQTQTQAQVQSQIGQLSNNNQGFSQVDPAKPLFERFDEENFQKCLNLLINGNISNKLDALLFIYDIASSENESDKNFLKLRANSLMQALSISFKAIFERPRDEIPTKFIHYFLNMTHKLCSVKLFMKSVSEQNLYSFSDDILNRLLIEDEEKQEKTENETVVKTLNSTMLRILENSNANDMFSVLFDLLIAYRRKHLNAKILGLIIKCMLKLTKSINQYPDLNPSILLLKSHIYICEHGADPTKISEDMGIKTIKTILNELVKIYQEQIWEYYQVLHNHQVKDAYIYRWISVILKPILGGNQQTPRINQIKGPNVTNTLENNSTLMENMQGQNISNIGLVPRIIMLIESIKTNPIDIEVILNQLYDEIIKYPGINLAPYFKGYPRNFIEYITNSLEKIDYQRKNFPKEEKIVQNEVQDYRYHRVKQVNQANNQIGRIKDGGGNSQNDSSSSDSSQSSGNNQMNLEEYHNKVNNLKMRYGNLMRENENQAQLNAFPNEGGQFINRNNMINPSNRAMSQDQFDHMNTLSKTQFHGGTDGLNPMQNLTNTSNINIMGTNPGGVLNRQYGKTTENILQKLNEMKMKMQGTTNSNNKSL